MEKTPPTPLNDNLKFVCLRCYDEFLNDQFLYNERSKIYDILSDGGYMNFEKKEIREFYLQAQNELIKAENEKPVKQRRIYSLVGNKSLTVIFRAKVLALETYFARIDAEGTPLNEILNKV